LLSSGRGVLGQHGVPDERGRMAQLVDVNPTTEHHLYLTLYVSNSGGV
jgi:hypothetical protein